MSRWLGSVALAHVCLAIAACTAVDDGAVEADPDGAVAATAVDSEGVDSIGDPSAEGATASSGADESSEGAGTVGVGDVFNEIEAVLRQLTGVDSKAVADCMHAVGFPQAAQLNADTASIAASQTDDLLLIHPGHLGPYTQSQAREFGLVGSRYIPDRGSPEAGTIRSNDPAFFSARDACVQDARDSAEVNIEGMEGELKAISQAAVQLRYTLQSAFGHRFWAKPELDKLLAERSTCLVDLGYEGGDREWESGESWEDLLRRYGIEPGERKYVDQGGGEEESTELNTPLRPGETRVVLHSDMPVPKYYPSAAEVDLALAYVECVDRIAFLERLEQLQIPIRAETLAEFETQILGLREELDTLLYR